MTVQQDRISLDLLDFPGNLYRITECTFVCSRIFGTTKYTGGTTHDVSRLRYAGPAFIWTGTFPSPDIDY